MIDEHSECNRTYRHVLYHSVGNSILIEINLFRNDRCSTLKNVMVKNQADSLFVDICDFPSIVFPKLP